MSTTKRLGQRLQSNPPPIVLQLHEEAAVEAVDAAGQGDDDWAAKGGWEEANNQCAQPQDDNWASWNEDTTTSNAGYDRQTSRESQQQQKVPYLVIL